MTVKTTFRIVDRENNMPVDLYEDEGNIVLRQENARIIFSPKQFSELSDMGGKGVFGVKDVTDG